MSTTYTVTDADLDAIRETESLGEAFVVAFKWWGIDLTDDRLSDGEVDPTQCVLSEDDWTAVGQILLEKYGQGALLTWMSQGPSGGG